MTFESPLSDLVRKLEKQNDILGRARNEYLGMEAERKHFESKLVSRMPFKTHSERLTEAQATSEWLDFHKRLARLEAIYEFQKLRMEVLNKEWQSAYLELKLSDGLIKKQDR